MQEIEKNFTENFSSFGQLEERSNARGMNDWAVPWSDLMMVMFVLFVVLFIYAENQQDVKVLFSPQSSERAQSTSALDPLIGLIGQIASRADASGSQDIVRVPEKEVLYRSRANGITVVREAPGRIRISLRGAVFFDAQSGRLKGEAGAYLDEIAKVVKLSLGSVHVIGYADTSEAEGTKSFSLSTQRATDVAEQLISRFSIDPKRILITGRGAYMPELPETTQANQARNRRVEILIEHNS